MLTPQDIREKTFEKAVFGGYDMGAVDECLEEIYEDYSALHKENATLKAKLKVLAAKIEEYRESEDAMRMALLSAQKTGAQIEAESKLKADAMVAEAEVKAANILRNAQQSLAEEDARLVEAKRQSAQFLQNMRLLCEKQLGFLDQIGEMKIIDSAPDAETVKAIQDNVAKAAAEAQPELDISRELDSIVTPNVTVDSDTKPFTPVKGFSFDDLKYGKE